jgi:hypothetical protein
MISTAEVGSVVSTHLRGGAPAASGPARPAPADPGSATDGVVLSGQPGLVSRMIAALHALPEVRSERVQQVRAALQSGQRPSAQEVAHQIVNRIVSDRLAGGTGT